MRENAIYRIHVINFNKHNAKLKKAYKATLISNNFCDDAKLGLLPLTVRWMFLAMVLTCGDHTSDTIEMSESRLRDLLESSWSIPRALEALETLQLVTFEKITPFINEIKENKRKLNKSNSSCTVVDKSTQVPAEISKLPSLQNQEINPQNEFELVCLMPQETKTRWARLYQSEEYLQREVIKAFNYYRNNPRKFPKTRRGWVQALSSWFERGWPAFVKTIPAEKPELSQDYWDRVFSQQAV